MIWVELKELASDRTTIRQRIDLGGPPSISPEHDHGRFPDLAQSNDSTSIAYRLSALVGKRQPDGAQWSSTEAVLLALSRRLLDRWRTKQANSFTRDGRVAPSFSHLAAFGLKVLS